jgi:hypothetical protein
MGTPNLRYTSPEVDEKKCFVCFQTADSCIPRCKLQHKLCNDCTDYFCPFCLEQIAVLKNETFEVVAKNGVQIIGDTNFKIEIEFCFNFLKQIRVLNSTRNFRLQCHWIETQFDIFVLRNREPYFVNTIVNQRKPGQLLKFQIIPPNPAFCSLEGSLCSWRIYMDVYPFVFDRPEIARLKLLPDNFSLFLEQQCQQIKSNWQFWQFDHSLVKYESFLFATIGPNLVCVQCQQEFKTLEELSKSCLGGLQLATLENLKAATPVEIIHENGKTKRFSQKGTIENVLKKQNLFESKKLSPISNQVSTIFKISLTEKVSEISVCKYFHQLCLLNNQKIPKFICYDLKFDQDDNISSFLCWICWPISIPFCSTIIVDHHLNKFQSLMYLSLHRNIFRYGIISKTCWGSISKWQKSQAANVS